MSWLPTLTASKPRCSRPVPSLGDPASFKVEVVDPRAFPGGSRRLEQHDIRFGRALLATRLAISERVAVGNGVDENVGIDAPVTSEDSMKVSATLYSPCVWANSDSASSAMQRVKAILS
jgi:hypothetical protein